MERLLRGVQSAETNVPDDQIRAAHDRRTHADPFRMEL
jgi:hypothetical protein